MTPPATTARLGACIPETGSRYRSSIKENVRAGLRAHPRGGWVSNASPWQTLRERRASRGADLLERGASPLGEPGCQDSVLTGPETAVSGR
jgi:hypothetical protein